MKIKIFMLLMSMEIIGAIVCFIGLYIIKTRDINRIIMKANQDGKRDN